MIVTKLRRTELPEPLKAKRLRAVTLPEGALNLEARTIELTMASETPVPRYAWDLGDFDEILLCGPENVDLSRMTPEASGPLLLDHDMRQLVGVVDESRVDALKRVVRCLARVQRSEQGDQVLRDVEDLIRRNVSVGYFIEAIEIHEERGERPRVVVTRWQPFEVSLVSSGADPTVGIGRNAASSDDERAWAELIAAARANKGNRAMDPKNKPGDAGDGDGTAVQVREPRVDVGAAREEARKAEQGRVREILALGERFGASKEAVAAINDGTSAAEFRDTVLDLLEQKANERAKTPAVDLGKRDAERYSFGRALLALANGDPSSAGLEWEVTRAYAEEAKVPLQKPGRSIYVPLRYLFDPASTARRLRQRSTEVLQRLGLDHLIREVTKGGSGSNLVGTDHMDSEYVPHLLSDLVLAQAGVRILPGLIGDVDIPAGDGVVSGAAFVSTETSDATEQTPAFRTIPLSPKSIRSYIDFTRRMRQQSLPAIENICRNHLEDSILELVEQALFTGDGLGGSFTGVYNAANTVASPFAASFAYRDWVDMWVALRNARGSRGALSFVTSFGVAGKAMVTPRNGTGSDRMIMEMSGDGVLRVDGWPVYATQLSPQTLGSPATSHGVAFADWSRLIVGTWGEGIEIAIDDAAKALSGGRRLIGFYDLDAAVTLPQSFVLAQDVDAS